MICKHILVVGWTPSVEGKLDVEIFAKHVKHILGILQVKLRRYQWANIWIKICGTSIHKSMEICCRKLFEVTN